MGRDSEDDWDEDDEPVLRRRTNVRPPAKQRVIGITEPEGKTLHDPKKEVPLPGEPLFGDVIITEPKPRWYFGGLASMGAACITHPLDLVKVLLQTQTEPRLGVGSLCWKVLQTDGLLGFYSGISASMLRQVTASVTRFAIYDVLKEEIASDRKPTFPEKVVMSGAAGFIGGVVGTPGDLINVRMQNDVKLPWHERRNYHNGLDGLVKVYHTEGVGALFGGVRFMALRASFITIGQIAFYEEIKEKMLSSGKFKDNASTYFISSAAAATTATVITQPLDVMKTLRMNAAPGQLTTLKGIVRVVLSKGPLGFFSGILPAWIRITPQTILTFMLKEQLTRHFGK